MQYLPIELDVHGHDALVIGAGAVAVPKVERLVHAGARITVVAPHEVDPALEAFAASGHVTLLRRSFEPRDLEGKRIVFVAPGDDALSQQLFLWGSREGRLVCTLDRPELCTFINPAVVRTSGLTMSFSSAGASPGTLRRIREDLEALFSDPRFTRYLDALRSLRASLPRSERAARMAAATQGFAVEARLHFPAWLERGGAPEAPAQTPAPRPKSPG